MVESGEFQYYQENDDDWNEYGDEYGEMIDDLDNLELPNMNKK